MGGSHSKTKPSGRDDGPASFAQQIRANIEDEVARRAMVQREVQMAINVARARDTIWIFGSAWSAMTVGIAAAGIVGGRPVPGVAAVPVLAGALVLGNMVDMAYGNKMARVTKEAEYILDNERGRFYPVPRAPFAKFYTEEERGAMFGPATAVGDLFPNGLLFGHLRRPFPPPPSRPASDIEPRDKP